MRKISFFTFLLFAFTVFKANSQTIVGTTPENRNVVLEEFTGIHCGYCPDGHAIAQAIQNDNPDDVFLVNIHTGGYAAPGAGEPDFRTPFGNALGSQSGLAGYPAGTVNRHYFPGTSQGTAGTTAQSRSTWATTSNTVLGEESYVNVAVEASLDLATRDLTIHVEAYYTGDSPEATNFINVALLQDNTLGPQSGGGAGDSYNHMHRLIGMVTGQWGEVVETTTTGTFIDVSYTYNVPFLNNDVVIVPENLKVVAFITETHHEIETGSGSGVTLVGSAPDNDVAIDSIVEIEDTCATSLTPSVSIFNASATALESLDFEYSVNAGAVQTYSWSGSIAGNALLAIDLPEIAFDLTDDNTLFVSIQDDDNNANNESSTSFGQVSVSADYQTVTVELQQDNYGSETTWELIDMATGNVLLSGGPYTNSSSAPLITESVDVAVDGCYSFKINDSYGDGICCAYGVGYYKIYSGGEMLFEGGSFGFVDVNGFVTPNEFLVGTNELAFQSVQIFPNPAKTQISVRNAAGLDIALFDVLGRKVFSKTNISVEESIDLTTIAEGTYMLKITDDNVSRTEKIIVLK